MLRSGAALAFAMVLAVFALTSPLFLTIANLANVLQQSIVIGLLGFGLTIVLIAGGPDPIRGGLDLSVAANLGFCAAVYAVTQRNGCGTALSVAFTLAAGAAVGALNAVAVIALRIVPLLATLTTMNIAAGFELVLTQNTSVSASGTLTNWLLDDGSFGVPHLAYALLLAAALFTVLAHYTPFGLRLAAVGAHRDAAHAAGLRTRRYLAASYLLSGIAAALAALASTALLSGSAPGAGDNLLAVVAAALLGIVFSRRLVPTIPGTLCAVLFVGAIVNGFQLDNVSSYYVNGVEGALILFVVATTAIVRRRRAGSNVYD
ncbi:ABC transporter permease [Trinickia symbiotica]|uniref:ABC transporter permease n=1 Tax=Trinickia symbiotica TaxID=863227 RepID=A0A2T3XR97_9BURK|nr:ABC transporter permease [Trinickia symbiotica]PTB18987.1 ABC transporter permease [Trinickia symbiotica]